MKRLLFILILLVTFIIHHQESYGCMDEYPTHNYYMISFVNRDVNASLFTERIDEFWRHYTNGLYEVYPSYDQTGLEEYIRSKGDTDMLAYLSCLYEYLDYCNAIRYGWDYPDASELEERNTSLHRLMSQSKSYKGDRLRPQYSLLYMRCNMLLENWEENKRYWEKEGYKLDPSVFRDMMENIYAGALFHCGNRTKATEIFLRQGDDKSVRWTLSQYRNLSGIRSIYNQDPNSPLLPYLLTVYVNNTQERIDTRGNTDPADLPASIAYDRKECHSFCAFADSVLSEGMTADPCMWATSAGMLCYLNGSLNQAKSYLSKASTMRGTERAKDNSRCVRLLIHCTDSNQDRNWILSELQWLETKCASEHPDGYCYSNAMERILMKTLQPHYQTSDPNLALALVGMYSEMEVQHNPYHHRSLINNGEGYATSWNCDYDNEYMQLHLYKLSGDDCAAYYKYLTTPHDDPFETYVCSHTYQESDFFNDLIGTKYMASGDFVQAKPYLEKVSLKYLNMMNVGYMMHHRDFTQERWFVKQRKEYDPEGFCDDPFTTNPKLDYCNLMLSELAQYKRSSQLKKELSAYRLATLYYQGSYKGDCWWLTSHYNHTLSTGPTYDWELDYVAECRKYLQESYQSKNKDLREKSLYALAFTPTDLWAEWDYDYEGDDVRVIYSNPDPMSTKYKSLDQLSTYYLQQRNEMPSYVSRCDVLRQFRRLKIFTE